jgi:hypothetical protein
VYAGHLGFALGAYSFRKTVPLWLLLIAAQLPDWMDAGMCIASLDRGPSGLYTHGFHALSTTAFGLAFLYAAIRRDLIGAGIVALTVFSHYGLDYITGQKPTWPGGPIVGLALYSRPLIDLLLESITIFIGWTLYRRTIPEEGRNDFTVYSILLALIGFQIAAGIAFYFDMGGGMKC